MKIMSVSSLPSLPFQPTAILRPLWLVARTAIALVSVAVGVMVLLSIVVRISTD